MLRLPEIVPKGEFKLKIVEFEPDCFSFDKRRNTIRVRDSKGAACLNLAADSTMKITLVDDKGNRNNFKMPFLVEEATKVETEEQDRGMFKFIIGLIIGAAVVLILVALSFCIRARRAKLGGYTMGSLVGKGAHSFVYDVHKAKGLNNLVIKVCNQKSLSTISVAGHCTMTEAKILEQLNHAHIVKYVDSFPSSFLCQRRSYCIVMIKCNGGNLLDFLENQELRVQ